MCRLAYCGYGRHYLPRVRIRRVRVYGRAEGQFRRAIERVCEWGTKQLIALGRPWCGLYWFALWISCLLGFVEVAVARESASSANEFLDLWQSATDEIWSFDVVLQISHSTRSGSPPTLKPVTTYWRRHRYLQGMWRVDRLDELQPKDSGTNVGVVGSDQTSAIAWDGQEVHGFRSQEKFGSVLSTRDVNISDFGSFFFDQLFRNALLGGHYVGLIRARKNVTASRKNDGGVIVDAAPMPTLPATFNDRRIVVELDPERNYMPEKIWVSSKLDLTKADFEIENVLTEVTPATFLPTTSVVRLFQRGEVLSEQRIEIAKDDLRVNIDLNSSDFRLRFPVGTVVYDRATNRNFLSGSNEERDFAGFDKFAANYAKQHTNVPTLSRTRRPWLAVAGASMILAVLMLFVVARRSANARTRL